ncbi:MAG: ABC transporter substrate-binding protein [Myxococcales bacterium]|nr:ABC transporter substrate-binding protein [Myxococcales bacterium]
MKPDPAFRLLAGRRRFPATRGLSYHLLCLVLCVSSSACTGVTTRPDRPKKRISETTKKDADEQAKRGLRAYEQGEHRAALVALRRAVESGADMPVVALSQLYIAKAHFALGEFDRARESLKTIDPQSLSEPLRREAQQLRYLLRHKEKGCADAEKTLDPPLTVERDLALSRRFLLVAAACRIELKQWERALLTLERVPAAFDNKIPALNEWVLHWQRRIVRREVDPQAIGRLLSDKLPMIRPLVLVRALRLASREGDGKRVQELLKALKPERLGRLDAALVKEVEQRWRRPHDGGEGEIVLAVLPLSGSLKGLAQQIAKGMAAALRVFGPSSGGSKLRVQLVDANDPRGVQVVNAAIRTNSRVVAVIGLVPDASRYKSLLTTLETERVPALLFTTRAKFKNPYHIGVFPDPMLETEALVRQLALEQKSPRCAVIRGVRTIDRLRARRFASELKKRGGTVVAELAFEHQADFSQRVRRLRAHAPSCVYLPLAPALAGLVLRYLAGNDIFPKKTGDRLATRGKSRQIWVAGCASWQQKALIAESERYLQGVRIPLLFHPNRDKVGLELESYVKSVFGGPLEPAHALGFLALSLVSQSCGATCSRGSLLSALSQWKSSPTPFGVVSRTTAGSLHLEQKIYALHGTTLVPLK